MAFPANIIQQIDRENYQTDPAKATIDVSDVENLYSDLALTQSYVRNKMSYPITATGTANAITGTNTDIVAVGGTYATNLIVLLTATLTNTGATTVNFNSISTKNIKVKDNNNNKLDTVAGDFVAGKTYKIIFDSVDFVLQKEKEVETYTTIDNNNRYNSVVSSAIKSPAKVVSMRGNTEANLDKIINATITAYTNTTMTNDTTVYKFGTSSKKATSTGGSTSFGVQKAASRIANKNGYYFGSVWVNVPNAIAATFTQVEVLIVGGGVSNLTTLNVTTKGTWRKLLYKFEITDFTQTPDLIIRAFGSANFTGADFINIDDTSWYLREITSSEFATTLQAIDSLYPTLVSTRNVRPFVIRSMGTNLLPNGNGENGLYGWTYSGNPPLPEWNNVGKYWTLSWITGGSAYIKRTDLLKAGVQYTFNFKYRKTNTQNPFITFYYNHFDRAYPEIQVNQAPLTSTSTTTYSITYTPLFDGYMDFYLTPGNVPDCSMQISEIQVNKGSSILPYASYVNSEMFVDWGEYLLGKRVGNFYDEVNQDGTYTRRTGVMTEGSGVTKSGSARTFDGTSNGKITASAGKVMPIGGKSIEFKFKKNGNPVSTQYIMGNTPNTDTRQGDDITVLSTGQISYVINGSPTSQTFTTVANNLCDNLERTIKITWDGTTGANGVTIYINGVIDIQGTAVITQQYTATNNFAIGQTFGGTAPFIGQLNNLAIKNFAETETYINWNETDVAYALFEYVTGKIDSEVLTVYPNGSYMTFPEIKLLKARPVGGIITIPNLNYLIFKVKFVYKLTYDEINGNVSRELVTYTNTTTTVTPTGAIDSIEYDIIYEHNGIKDGLSTAPYTYAEYATSLSANLTQLNNAVETLAKEQNNTNDFLTSLAIQAIPPIVMNNEFGIGNGYPLNLAGQVAFEQFTVTKVNATRTITLTPQPGAYFWWKYNKQFITAPLSVQILPVEGVHAIVYNGETRTLRAFPFLAVPSNDTYTFYYNLVQYFGNDIYTVAAYWNNDDGKFEFIGHQAKSPQDIRTNIFTRRTGMGTAFGDGLGLTGFTLGNGSLNSHAQFGTQSGTSWTDGTAINHPTIASTVGLPVFYQTGDLLGGGFGIGKIRRASNPGFSVLTGANGRALYNLLSGGNWTIPEATSGYHILMHVYGYIDAESSSIRCFAWMGQSQHNVVADARTAARIESNRLNTPIIDMRNFVRMGSVIFETNSGFANAVKSIIEQTTNELGGLENYYDWRGKAYT